MSSKDERAQPTRLMQNGREAGRSIRVSGGHEGCGYQLAACSCQEAVLRVYDALTEIGRDDVAAFKAAVRTYRARHPEHSAQQACDQVADWIADELEPMG